MSMLRSPTTIRPGPRKPREPWPAGRQRRSASSRCPPIAEVRRRGVGCLRQSWRPIGSATAPAARFSRWFRTRDINPFVSHDFLSALETSIGRRPDRLARPALLVRPTDGTIVGIVPCYLKSIRRANTCSTAAGPMPMSSAGGSYYPKLQASVPFTPATGPRLLVRQASMPTQVRGAGARSVGLCRIDGASGVHVTFATRSRMELPGEPGFLQRTDQQFHWHNPGYAQLRRFSCHARLAPPQGDQARTARSARQRHHHSWLTGSDITEDAWDASLPSTWTPARANGAGPT